MVMSGVVESIAISAITVSSSMQAAHHRTTIVSMVAISMAARSIVETQQARVITSSFAMEVIAQQLH